MAYIYIYNYKVAKDLLRNGFIIKDIKPNNLNPYRTTFCFAKGKAIIDYLKNNWNISVDK